MMQCTELLITFLCLHVERVIPGRASQFHVPTSCADWVISWTWTVRMRFGQEGMATYISAFGKGDLLTQVIVQQSNILNYLPSPWKARSANAIKLKQQSCSYDPSINQSGNQPIDLSVEQALN